MRRRILAVMCAIWAVTILACTGATATVLALPGGLFVHQDDYWVWSLGRANPNDGLVGGHITKVGFDDRFVLIRADDYETYHDDRRKPKFRLTGKVVHFYVVEVSPTQVHGPFTEAQFDAARIRLGVPVGLTLEPADEVRLRVNGAW